MEPRASANVSAEAGRSAGFLARQARTMSSNADGTPISVRAEGGTGTACVCFMSISMAVCPVKTSSPVISQYARQPTAYAFDKVMFFHIHSGTQRPCLCRRHLSLSQSVLCRSLPKDTVVGSFEVWSIARLVLSVNKIDEMCSSRSLSPPSRRGRCAL